MNPDLTMRRRTAAALIACAVALLAGCAAATSAPRWESRLGDSVRQANAAQVRDPQAPGRHADIRGLDGKAAAGAMKGYAESYGYAVKEAKQPAVSITNSSNSR